MRHAGDGRTFMASAAVLMAGLVIATMLAINAKLQSALSPAATEAGAPIVQAVAPRPAPALQSTAAPSIARSPVAAAVVATQPQVVTAAPVDTRTVPAKVTLVAKPASPVSQAVTLAASLSSVKITTAPPAAAVVPAVSTPVVVTPTLSLASKTVTASSSDLGDSVASTGERHGKNPSGADLTAASAANDPQVTDPSSDQENEGDGDSAAAGSDSSPKNSHGDSHGDSGNSDSHKGDSAGDD